MRSLAYKVINIPTIFICLVIIKLPFFNKYKIHLLSTFYDLEKRSKVDNLLFRVFFAVWIKFEYLQETNPDHRESLKSLALGGKSGRNWAQHYQNKSLDLSGKVGNMLLKDACPLFKEVITFLTNLNQKCIVIQIGSSSGKETRFFANMFPLHTFIGTDIYEEVVNYSNSCHDLPNLSFVQSSAKDIEKLLNKLNNYIIGKKILIYSSGSLNYVQPEHLVIFFKSLNKYPNVSIMINEGGSEANGMPNTLKTSIFRGCFSYTHDYKWYAEESGIETVRCEIIRPYYPYEDFPSYRRNTVHFFYYGKTKIKKIDN